MTQTHWVDDVPAQAEVLALDLPDLDLTLFTGVTASLTDPAGVAVDLTGATFTLDAVADTVTIGWGAATVFDAAGIYSLQLTLTGAAGVTQRVDPERIVVEENTGWHTLGSARGQWVDAPNDDAQLYELLDIAGGQVLTYAPALAVDARIPVDYYKAQLMQARNLWNATKADGDQMGPDGFTIVVKPLDWHVKNLLRPKRGVPVIW